MPLLTYRQLNAAILISTRSHTQTYTKLRQAYAWLIRTLYGTQVKFICDTTSPRASHKHKCSFYSFKLTCKKLLPISCYDPHRITEKTLIYYSQLLTQLNQPTQLIKLSKKATESKQNQQSLRKNKLNPQKMALSCSVSFDRGYLFGIHGWLDAAKLIFGLITWIIILLTNTSGKGVWTFLLSMSVASWIGTLLWMIILGIFFPCLVKNCCTKHIPWIWIPKVNSIFDVQNFGRFRASFKRFQAFSGIFDRFVA